MNKLAFIGGGNMARAIVGGLIGSGRQASSIVVVDPGDAQRAGLRADFGVLTLAEAGPPLAGADLVVWAVKPQMFKAAAQPCAPYVDGALQLSVMAGIPSAAIVSATGVERVVRAMPNTPALIGQGIAGLFGRATVTTAERLKVESVLAPTGRLLWFENESDLDAVTAISGSGPAYVFYVVEAMIDAAVRMGLSAEQGRELALATFAGATALAAASSDPPALLRERVTSKGGTTHAALEVPEAAGVKAAFGRALAAARHRAAQMGNEFGA